MQCIYIYIYMHIYIYIYIWIDVQNKNKYINMRIIFQEQIISNICPYSGILLHAFAEGAITCFCGGNTYLH